MKYRIKEYEALVTRYKGGKWAEESMETVYQIEMRSEGFFGRIFWGWSDVGSAFFTEEEARHKVAEYKRAEGPRFGKKDTTFRYIYID